MKLLFILILFVPNITFSQVDNPKWDYPIKPGTPEWKSLNSNLEKVLSCQIPENILVQMKTSYLLDICSNYPLLPDIFAFNNIKDGFDKFEGDFNGFRELIKRPDCAKEMIRVYKSMSAMNIRAKESIIQKGDFIVHFSLFELMLSHLKIIEQMTIDERKDLLNELKVKKGEKKLYSSWEGRIGLQPSALAMINIIKSDTKYQMHIEDKIINFINYGIMENSEIPDEIEKIVNNYIKLKK